MKNYTLTVEGITHTYAVPYERNDYFLKIKADNNPLLPESQYQPPLGKTLYADVDFEYNYYAEDYEHMTQKIPDEDTFLLSSLNYFLLHQEGLFPENEYIFLSTVANKIELAPERLLSKQYFNKFGNAIEDLSSQEYIDISKIQNNLNLNSEYLSKTSLDIYKDNENKREMFPFFGKVHLTGMPTSGFAGIMETAGMDKMFIDFLIMHRNDHAPIETKVDIDSLDSIVAYVIKYDYQTLLSHITNHGGLSFSFDSSVQNTDDCDLLERYIEIEIAKNKMKDYIQRNLNSNKVEPIAYRLEKYTSENSTNFIQASYFFNLSELEEFRYYDSQVCYGHHYTYKIKVINAVFGNQLYFFEEPYYEDYFRVLDSPPVAPDINILTYRGVDNRILITLNSMIDKKVESPVLINPSDKDSFARQWEAQKITEPNPILFESDDPTMFEIFRLDHKPHTYQEFVNGMYKVVGKANRTAAGYHDMIAPNKTYYYTFRSQDMHGHVSNPTEVFEFRMNKEGETLYPTLRIVDMKPKDPPTQKNISFKRYLKIGLAPSQYQIPESEISKIEDTIVNQDIKIGTSDEPLAGSNRKFKFRIRSKSTGKIIDVNVTFKKNKVFNE